MGPEVIYKRIHGNDVYFKTRYDIHGNVVQTKMISCPRKTFKMNGYRYIMLFDCNCILRRDMFRYLNTDSYIGLKPWNTREQYGNALKLLLCFSAIDNKPIEHLDRGFYQRFRSFLSGRFLGKNRCAETVGNYLLCCKVFLQQMDYDYSCFMEKGPRRNPHKNDAYPTYITLDQFVRIITVTLKHHDVNAFIILILMFVFCSRIGALLGLTWEDLSEGISSQTGETYACLKCRNRLSSNEKWAQNKRKSPVFHEEVYDSSDYKDETYEIRIPYVFSDYIRSTLMERHKLIAKKHPENYKKSEADIVTSPSDHNRIPTNHYLFINNNGTVLSYDNWNKTLKKYFVEAGIPLDGKSVSHRFRHGGVKALQMISEGRITDTEIAFFLGHAGLSSVDVYKKETLDEVYQKLNNYSSKLLEIIKEHIK